MCTVKENLLEHVGLLQLDSIVINKNASLYINFPMHVNIISVHHPNIRNDITYQVLSDTYYRPVHSLSARIVLYILVHHIM